MHRIFHRIAKKQIEQAKSERSPQGLKVKNTSGRIVDAEKKKGSSLLSFLFNMEREKSLELSTYTLARYRSTN